MLKMKLKPTKHEDERRVLIEYISGVPFKRAKILQTKMDCLLGKHYHKENDSGFYLFKGKGSYLLKPLDGIQESGIFEEGDCLFVPRGVIHTFDLKAGSIMLDTASEILNLKDEISVM